MHITAGRPQKSGPRATEWFTAPSINWRWAQKHSQIVHKTSVDQRYFTQTAIDCKSTDLKYTLQQRDYKEKRPQNAESFQKRNEPKTRYCGHPFSRLSRVWT